MPSFATRFDIDNPHSGLGTVKEFDREEWLLKYEDGWEMKDSAEKSKLTRNFTTCTNAFWVCGDDRVLSCFRMRGFVEEEAPKIQSALDKLRVRGLERPSFYKLGAWQVTMSAVHVEILVIWSLMKQGYARERRAMWWPCNMKWYDVESTLGWMQCHVDCNVRSFNDVKCIWSKGSRMRLTEHNDIDATFVMCVLHHNTMHNVMQRGAVSTTEILWSPRMLGIEEGYLSSHLRSHWLLDFTQGCQHVGASERFTMEDILRRWQNAEETKGNHGQSLLRILCWKS